MKKDSPKPMSGSLRPLFDGLVRRRIVPNHALAGGGVRSVVGCGCVRIDGYHPLLVCAEGREAGRTFSCLSLCFSRSLFCVCGMAGSSRHFFLRGEDPLLLRIKSTAPPAMSNARIIPMMMR